MLRNHRVLHALFRERLVTVANWDSTSNRCDLSCGFNTTAVEIGLNVEEPLGGRNAARRVTVLCGGETPHTETEQTGVIDMRRKGNFPLSLNP